ncbi:adenine DNA glycosylase-like isoform X1 [Biomphalaria glabrata]|uniref:Adenine DNA glycosylase n=2 Tax=Biomphalaria glabrata TaxID=6526 RepID=A0A9W3AIQ4_BIOGL|nr:adenine DNA glycosylase-like isoform X1 [Biomphalaria glabrata]
MIFFVFTLNCLQRCLHSRHLARPNMKKRKQVMMSSNDDNVKPNLKLKQNPPFQEDSGHSNSVHEIQEAEIQVARKSLLSWYDQNKRDLPWRNISSDNVNQKAYAVWVSEIMLQQTQVATVINYYNKWMQKWPTLEALAASNIEAINEAWSGLGYYSRGRRLFEGAQKIVKEMSSLMPATAAELEKKLPGVGRYTAAAIASIAFGEVTGLVDGNVIRVITRLRLIGASINQQEVIEKIWSLANQLVDPKRPGDFNQSMMELGAVVCTPKTPSCGQCPVNKLCLAYKMVEFDKRNSAKRVCVKLEDNNSIPDIECLIPNCNLCLPPDQPWDKESGVQNFPRKPKKSAAKQVDLNVVIVSATDTKQRQKFLITQRPKKGLLAGLWEFPTNEGCDSAKEILSQLCKKYDFQEEVLSGLHCIGEVTHLFSHVHHHYKVWSTSSSEELDVASQDSVPCKWLSEEELTDAAMSTGMRKVFKVFKNDQLQSSNQKVRKRKSAGDDVPISHKKTQAVISDFFKRK